jgi:hypothetical protein
MMKQLIVATVCITVLVGCRAEVAQEEEEVRGSRAVAQPAEQDGPKQPASKEAGEPKAEQEPAKPKAPEPKLDQAKLDKKFAETLSGATLVGHFTMGDNPHEPREERYVINKVSKLKGDYWLFTARIQYGNKDLTVPMMLPVKWAGDTAVITVTDVGIPGMGTYTARVLIYNDQYAGTWSGGKRGGHLWGRIERGMDDGPQGKAGAEEATSEPPADAKPDAPAESKEEDGTDPSDEAPQR